MMIISSKDLNDTKELATKLSQLIKPGDIVFLNGEIGSGKTTFVKFFGEAIGIKTPITSPTFNIIKAYENKLCHVDGYRLNNDFVELEEYLDQDYIIFIEWSDCIDQNLTPNWVINFYYDEDKRLIKITKEQDVL